VKESVYMYSHLQLYSFPPRARSYFDDLACELDADRLRGEDPPLVFDEAVEETGPEDGGSRG